MHDAVVIGAGHNGLVAANVLADAGWSVLVVEAEDEPGGAVRSGELIEPGYVNDRFSAFYPLAAASPVFRRARRADPVQARAARARASVARRDDRSSVTRPRGDDDGASWPEVIERWERIEPALLRGLVTPFPQARAALMLALEPGAAKMLRLRPTGSRTGCSLGMRSTRTSPPRSVLGRAFGLLLTAFGQRYGFPCVEGGSGRLTELLVDRARTRGVDLRLGERVDRLPTARHAVLAAIDTWELARITGRRSRVERDPATVKVDWTLDGPIPWTSEPARSAPVVHLGGERDFVLFGQYSMVDPTRSPPGKETAWAYSHVLSAGEIEAQIERHAPGFGALVRGRRIEELPAGRVSLGTARWRNQLVLRPFHGRPATGLPNVYLASASAHPGGGVHGASGWIAAQAALRSASRRRRARGLASLTISST